MVIKFKKNISENRILQLHIFVCIRKVIIIRLEKGIECWARYFLKQRKQSKVCQKQLFNEPAKSKTCIF